MKPVVVKVGVTGKRILVIGSQWPWLEVVLLARLVDQFLALTGALIVMMCYGDSGTTLKLLWHFKFYLMFSRDADNFNVFNNQEAKRNCHTRVWKFQE